MTDATRVADYRSIVAHYEQCLALHGDTCRGVDWPNAADARIRYQVMMEVIRPGGAARPSLLDFGCGASHLYEYLQSTKQERTVEYCGLDLSPRFVSLARTKFPRLPYYCTDLLQAPASVPTFDYIAANGVFTEKCGLDHAAMQRYFLALVRELFAHVRVGLAFNVMSSHVDWERDDLFHVPFDWMVSALTEHVSRDFVLRQDYGLYEYTVYAYRRTAPADR